MKLPVALFPLFYLTALSNEFELGRLYHYSYESEIEVRSFGFRAFPKGVHLNGHVDVCTVWSDGDDELLRVEFHKLAVGKATHSDHSHSASAQSDFALVHIRGSDVADLFFPVSTNGTVSALLNGFVQLLVPRNDLKAENGNFVVKSQFENSFGGHHPISIDAKQEVILPILDYDAGSANIEPVSLTTTVFGHLISTSECSQITVDGKDAKTALDAITARAGSVLSKFQPEVHENSHTNFISQCQPPAQSSSLKEVIAHVDCVAGSSSAESHKNLFATYFSTPKTGIALLRRYFSNVCLRKLKKSDFDVVVGSIVESLNFAIKSTADIGQDIVYGVACLLNQVCAGGQSTVCQRMSALVFDHLHSAYIACQKVASPSSCQLGLVRAFESSLGNFPMAIPFIYEIAATPNQHPQILSGSLRALQRAGAIWHPTDAEFQTLLDFFEKSQSFEVRFAALDFFLSPSSVILGKPKFSNAFAQSVQQILSGKAAGTEFGAYLSTRIRHLIANNGNFRSALLSSNGRLFFYLAPQAVLSENQVPTSVFIGGELFARSPLTYVLDVQNAVPDTLVHSSFSVNVRDRKLLEVEIDAVGLEVMMGSLLGDSSNSADQKAGKGAATVDPAASFTLKLSSSRLGNVVVARHADLFRGQDDLMSAVWNAPSEPTDISKVNVSVATLSDSVTLINGLRVDTAVAIAVNIAVQGSASISLWSQNAETLIATNVGVSAKTSFSIPSLSMARSLDISGAADLSFRTNIALGSSGRPDVCLRMTHDKAVVLATLSPWNNKKSQGGIKQTSSLSFAPVNYAFHLYNSQSCAKQLQASGDSW